MGNKNNIDGVEDKFDYALATYQSNNGNIKAPIGGNALNLIESDPSTDVTNVVKDAGIKCIPDRIFDHWSEKCGHCASDR